MAAAAAALGHGKELADELSNLPASPKGAPAAAAAASSGGGGDANATLNRCLVYCRLRPGKPQDFEDGAYQLVTVHGKEVKVKDDRSYVYDGTFDQDCRQSDIFERVGVPALEYALKGHCTAIMCYGQTGSGKSFTMVCTKPGHEGIIPRSAQWLFERIAADSSRKYTVVGQAVQIYRDNLGDLLQDGGKEKVDIRFDEKEGGVSLPGARSMEIASTEQFLAFYAEADSRRCIAATLMNPESSRSHCAYVIRINSQPSDESDCGARINSKITFIDLAGYERFSKTGISNSDPVRKDEAKTINASLLALGHVVTSLSNGDKHIPWRNAKLTRLLQDSIGGTSRTTIVLTCGPSSEHLHESTNTLQFGMRAMAVKVQSKISAHVDYEKLAIKLQALLDERDQKISSLEVQLATFNAEREELQERHVRDEDTLRVRHREELEKLRAEGASPEKIEEVCKLQELEVDNLREGQREELSYQQEQGEREMKALLEEQAKLTRRKEEEARGREEQRLKELEDKLAEARGADSQADLERCLKQLAERDAVLVSRAGERARLQALCATLIQQVKQLGGTPTHGGEFDENFVDITQVEEIKRMLEMQVQALTTQAADLRVQLSNVQEVATERANEVATLRQQLIEAAAAVAAAAAAAAPNGGADGGGVSESSSFDGAGGAGAAGDLTTTASVAPGPILSVPSLNLGAALAASSTTVLVDRSEVDTMRTLMQVDIDMLQCKVRMLEAQLVQAGLQPGDAGSALGIGAERPSAANTGGGCGGDGGGIDTGSFAARNDSFTSSSAPAQDSPPLTARRRRNTMMVGKDPNAAGGQSQQQQQQSGANNNSGSNVPASAKQLNDLRTKLLSFETANISLANHVKYLEGLVAEMGGVAMDCPQVEELATVQLVVETASEIARAKNDETERLMSLLEAREAVINDQATQIGTLSEDCRRAREQFPQLATAAGASSNDSAATLHSAGGGGQQAKQFIELIRAARAAQRTAEEKLYALQHQQRSAAAAVKLSALMEEGHNINTADLLPGGGLTVAASSGLNVGGSTALPSSGLNFAASGSQQQQQQHFDTASSVDSLMSPKYAPKSGVALNSLERATAAAAAAAASGLTASSPSSALPAELGQTLRMNDDRLLEAETRVIELEGQNASLKRMVAALERQLEIANMQPVCGLSKADRADVELERERDSEAARAAQDDLQRQLQQQLEERRRVEAMLEELSKQRAKDAAVYSKIEEQLVEQKQAVAARVQEDREESQSAMRRLQEEAHKHAAEAQRLKRELQEREGREQRQRKEAERIKAQLDAMQAEQREKSAEAERLRHQLEAKQAESEGTSSEAEKLKKMLEENTRALMAEQARKAQEGLEQDAGKKESGGFFSRLKNWKI